MPRLPRFVLVSHPQHVIIRGNNREPVFYADEDYQSDMVEHPAEYPWSSYRSNALNEKNELVVGHGLYKRLGKSVKERCESTR